MAQTTARVTKGGKHYEVLVDLSPRDDPVVPDEAIFRKV